MRTHTPLFVSLIAFVLLSSCNTPSAVARRQEAETYIRTNITILSPEPAVLGGTFHVTAIRWIDDDTAHVSYEDGHIALEGQTDIQFPGNSITASRIILDTPPPSSSSNATSSAGDDRPRAKEGEFCGGIAGFPCEDGLACILKGNYPDAGGTCERP